MNEKTPFTYGRDINSILSVVMDVEPRPPEVQKEFDLFYDMLEKEEFLQAEKKLMELAQLTSEDDVGVVRAKAMLEFERP